MAKPFWTPERDAEMLRLRDQGLPLTVISARFGINKHAAADRVFKLGLTNKRKSWTDEQRATLRELWPDTTIPARVIGERLGFTERQVQNQVAHLGLPLRITDRTLRAPSKAVVAAPTEPASPPPRPVRLVAPALPPALPIAPARACCWPMWGDRGRVPKPARYCGAAVVRGSYCGPHAATAYQPWKPREVAGG